MRIVFEKRARTDPGARRVAGAGVKISPSAERWHTGYQREEAEGATYAEWRIQPTVLFTNLLSENAWCPHS